MEELKLASVGLIAADSAPKIGKLVGADAIITGSFQIAGDQIRMDSMVIKVETGEILGGARASGLVSNVLDLQKKLADEMVIALGVREIKAPQKLIAEGWSKIKKFDGERERDIIAKRAYRFEASSSNRTKLKETLSTLKDLSHDDVLSEFNQWIPQIRGEKSAPTTGKLVKEGESVQYPGFLLPREYLDRIIFLKDERDLCLQHWDDQMTSKKK